MTKPSYIFYYGIMVTLRNEWQQLKELEPKRKVILLLILLGLFFLSFNIGAFIQVQRTASSPVRPVDQPFVPQPTATMSPATTLALAPSQDILELGEILSLAVVLTGKPMDLIDLTLQFDPKVFSPAKKLENGELFPIMFKEEIGKGTIHYAGSVELNAPEATATGTVFTIDLKTIAATSSAAIAFDRENTQIALQGEVQRVELIDGRYSVEK